MAPTGRMVDERWIGKNLEENTSDLIQALPRFLSGGTEEVHG
jgi:hypothetical protein